MMDTLGIKLELQTSTPLQPPVPIVNRLEGSTVSLGNLSGRLSRDLTDRSWNRGSKEVSWTTSRGRWYTGLDCRCQAIPSTLVICIELLPHTGLDGTPVDFTITSIPGFLDRNYVLKKMELHLEFTQHSRGSLLLGSIRMKILLNSKISNSVTRKSAT